MLEKQIERKLCDEVKDLYARAYGFDDFEVTAGDGK